MGTRPCHSNSLSVSNANAGNLRQQAISFIRGVSLSDLPELRYLANVLRFVPNLGVAVERLHAYAAQRLRIVHKFHPSYFSLILRKGEILEAHARDHAELVECCSQVRDRRGAVDILQLNNHPSFAPHLRHSGDGHPSQLVPHVPINLVNKVVGASVRFVWNWDLGPGGISVIRAGLEA